MKSSQAKILLIDANAIIHRAYHAFPKNLTTTDGKLVNAAYGFTKILLQTLKEFEPEYIVCAFDTRMPTFRHEMFKEYKAHRPKTDAELIEQFPLVKQVVEALNIPLFEVEGSEADDIIGTITKNQSIKTIEKIVVTGDKDLLQLIDKNTKIFLAGTSYSKSKVYNESNVEKKLGFPHQYLIDYKGLKGDPSDNIPGVKGVGDVTATNLIKKYGTLEEIYQNIEQISGAVQNKLKENADMAKLSKELATIDCQVNLDFQLSKAELKDYDQDKALKLFQELQFRSLVNELPKSKNGSSNNSGSEQLGLLGNIETEETSENTEIAEHHQLKNLAELESVLSEKKAEYVVIGQAEELTDDIFQKITKLILVIDSESYLVELEKFDLKKLEKILKQHKLVTYGGKRLIHACISSGIDLELAHDLRVAAYVAGKGGSKLDLATVVFNNVGIVYDPAKYSGLKQYLIRTQLIEKLTSPILNKLKEANINGGNGWGLEKLYTDVEMPLIEVLMQMERNGIFLDKDHLEKFAQMLSEKIAKLEKEIYKIAETEFNIDSPKQLGEILYDKLGVPGASKTKSGNYSTGEKVLSKIRESYPIADYVLQYRELAKLRSTYTNAIIELVNEKTGRIHTTFNQTVAATGRLSSTKPNLQNIPISTENGREIRKSFIAPEDKMLVFMDYSQQELRLLAHFSQEEKLIEAFNQGMDIHAVTAATLFNKEVDQVAKDERRIGKTVNFGVVYGISPFGLSDRLQIPREDGKRFIDTFYESYPKVKRFFDNLIKEAKTQGRVKTILGRERDASNLNSRNYQLRSATEREVINFPLQGSAADMMKLAMLEAHALIENEYSDFAKLIVQIHDELGFEVATKSADDKKLKEFAQAMREKMLNVLDLDIVMKVDVEIGYNMSELKTLKLN